MNFDPKDQPFKPLSHFLAPKAWWRIDVIAIASGTRSGTVPLPRSLGHFTGRKWLFLVYLVMIKDEVWYTSVDLPTSALE